MKKDWHNLTEITFNWIRGIEWLIMIFRASERTKEKIIQLHRVGSKTREVSEAINAIRHPLTPSRVS